MLPVCAAIVRCDEVHRWCGDYPTDWTAASFSATSTCTSEWLRPRCPPARGDSWHVFIRVRAVIACCSIVARSRDPERRGRLGDLLKIVGGSPTGGDADDGAGLQQSLRAGLATTASLNQLRAERIVIAQKPDEWPHSLRRGALFSTDAASPALALEKRTTAMGRQPLHVARMAADTAPLVMSPIVGRNGDAGGNGGSNARPGGTGEWLCTT